MRYKLIEKDGKQYFKIRICLKSKKNHRIRVDKQDASATTEKDASRIYRQLIREAERELAEKEQRGIPWGKLVGEWEMALREGTGSRQHIGKATAQDYVRALHLYTSEWMDRPIDEIVRYDVNLVLDELARLDLSNSRRRGVLNAINGLFRWAHDRGFIKHEMRFAANSFGLRKERETKPPILTLTEIRHLLHAAKVSNHPWYLIWAMALHTGMRHGELYSLLWSDVDLENKKIAVSKSYNGRFKIVKSTKSGDWREVPINSELEVILAELRATSNGRPEVLPRYKDFQRGESSRVLRAFCEGIGITPVTFHALRACFATQLLRANVAPAIVMKVCGWKELKTMQYYVRLAGLEVSGATDDLKLLPEDAVGQVVSLFKTP